jgi:hypothetical protein
MRGPGTPRASPSLSTRAITPLQSLLPSVRTVRGYLSTARRYRWLLLAVVALVWAAGLAAAVVEYRTTFESKATIWVLRSAPELNALNPDDPGVPIVQTAASQQADLLQQLLQTKSFLRDVADRTSLRTAIDAAPDDTKALDDIRTHFRIQTLGTNIFSVSYAGHDPRIAVELVRAALEVRGDRVAKARVDATTALGTLYQRYFAIAQSSAFDAQKELADFDASHQPPLSDLDQHRQAQLRLTLDLAQVRVNDIQGRIDQSVLAPSLVEISGTDFQVVDEPLESLAPSGGTRTAAMLAGVAIVAGLAIDALLVLVGTLIVDHITGPADVSRLAPATLFATVPRASGRLGGSRGDLRATLATAAFGAGDERHEQ